MLDSPSNYLGSLYLFIKFTQPELARLQIVSTKIPILRGERRKKNLQRLYPRHPTVPVRGLPFALCNRILTISIWTSHLQRNVTVTVVSLHRNPHMTKRSQGPLKAASPQMLFYKLNNKRGQRQRQCSKALLIKYQLKPMIKNKSEIIT